MGALYLCLGSTFLCLGSVWLNKGKKDKDLVDKFVATISSLDVDRCLEGHWTPDTLEGIIEDILN